jgi:hypothetical protein
MLSPEDVRAALKEIGRKGGLARAKALTPERRKEIARRAALARHGRCMDCAQPKAECACMERAAP